ncbi:glycosyltransferase [Plantactinospora sp. GCM10030261]|uniref:glycosyltransferase n=1 Tax=Plantactinospora sp. GCM10030261 TaxID=3273420 RepID=UPI003607D251
MGALLTVVVPIYNVERYLPECLDSVRDQTYRDLEVVLVDDGSFDGSGAVAAAYAATDPRFRLIRQANRGLGAARNVGIAAGTGDYLAFVDSDDVLPRYAFEVLVGALERTGSDFASGNVALMTSRGLRQSPLHRGTHRTTRLAISLARQRNLVYDRLACNKVFRRSFWDKHDLRFPEGVRYEDIPVTVPASALADSVDVLDLPVYYWRQREAGSEQSISQRQTELGNLVDRFAAVDRASRSLAALGDPKIKDLYDGTALQSDLRMFLDLLPDVDDTYRERFADLAADFLSRVDSRVIDRLAPRLRVAWRLATHRALPEVVAVVAASRAGAVPSVARRGLGRYLDLPLLDANHPAVPREAYRLATGVRTELHEVRWEAGGLHLRGLAYDATRGANRPWEAPKLIWLREHGGRRRVLPLPVRPRRVAQTPSSVPYGWAGFEVVLQASRLRDRDGWKSGDWSVNVAVLRMDGISRRTLGTGESRPVLPASWVAPGVRVVTYLAGGQLRLRVEHPRAWVTAVRIDGADLVVSGEVDRPRATALLRLRRVAGVDGFCCPVELSGAGWSARIPVADLAAAGPLDGQRTLVGEAGTSWRVLLDDDEGEPSEVPVLPGFTDLRHPVAGGVELTARPADDDVLWLRLLPVGPVVDHAELTGTTLRLGGDLPEHGDWRDLRILLRARDPGDPTVLPPPDVVLPVEVTGRRWTVGVDLGSDGPVDGDWQPLYACPDVQPVDLPFTVSARQELPRDVTVAGRRLETLPDRDREVLRLGPAFGRR